MRIIIDNKKNRLDQWDTGQRLRLLDIPAGAHVDFARPGTEPLGRETYEQDGGVYVNVPDAILQDAGGFGTWFYVRDGQRGETVRFWPGTALPRPKPADYIHTDEERKTWEELRREINLRHQYGYGPPGNDLPRVAGAFYIDLDDGSVYKCIVMGNGSLAWGSFIPQNYVMYDRDQKLPEQHQARARSNIGAASAEELARVKAAVSENVSYYATLFQAVEDANNGTRSHAVADVSTAKVKVFIDHSGALTVMLMDDVAESAQISVNTPLVLTLNGKTLSLTEVGAYLEFTVEGCAIDGRAAGSAIVKDFGDAAESCYFVDTTASLTIRGGSYRVSGANTGTVTAIRASNTCETLTCETLTMEDCTVEVINTADGAGQTRAIQTQAALTVIRGAALDVDTNGNAQGIFGLGDIRVSGSTVRANTNSESGKTQSIWLVGGTVRISDSRVLADAPGSEADTSSGVGIYTVAGSTVFADNCYISGTHSGISAHGNLYIDGGTYTGYSHGGVYFASGPDGINYVNDAVIRCGNYEGVHDYAQPRKNHSPLAAFYIGGGDGEHNSNVTVYMDGCSIEGNDNTTFVIRGTSGETNNKLYISNSVITKGSYVRVDNDTHRLYVGTGMSITEDMIRNADSTPATGRAEYTSELYRRHHGDATMDGRDYDALRRKTGSGGSGKSAYEYAREAGYDGTEEEFARKLAEDAPTKLSQLTNDLISGATVGQVARITAVDDNGVPTAWEAVEMAGGGETLELIVDLTTTEEVDSIQISKDLDGNSFSVRDAEFLVNIPVAAAKDEVVFNFAFSSVGGARLNAAMAATTSIATHGKLLSTRVSTLEKNTPCVLYASNSVGYYALGHTACTAADKFYVKPVTSGNKLPVGTRVRLWGIRV